MTAKDRSRLHRGYKRFLRQLKTKRQKRRKAQILCEENARYNRKNGVILSVDQLLSNTLSPSVSYLLNCIMKCTPNIGRISICLDGMSSVLYRAHVV